jgi:hypothetical protein
VAVPQLTFVHSSHWLLLLLWCLQGVGVTESNLVTPTLAYALGDPVPLATFKNKTLLSVIAAYTKKKDAGV